MPIPRKKSCDQCRRAKTRCNLAIPQCSRCIDRGLSCDYASHSITRAGPYAMQASSASTNNTTRRNNPTELRTSNKEQAQHVSPDSGFGPEAVFSEHVDMPAGWNLQSASIVAAETGLTPNIPVVVPQVLSYQGLFGFMDSWPIALTNQETADGDESLHLRSNVADAPILPGDKPSSNLAKRQALTAHAVLATKSMLGQIAAYPSMMTSGHVLPPFIHSQCALDDTISHDCLSKDAHQCLPRTLSICASLVNMHQTKTEASSGFVWDTVYAEVGRLAREYHTFNIAQLLEAVQALTIYILLQAFDQESIERNDIKSLLGNLWNIARKLHLSFDCRAVDAVENPLNRKDWVLYESIRRVMSLLSIVEIFVEVATGTCERWCDATFDSAPLPCIRDLWEVKSTYEWTRRYNAYLRSRRVKRTLKLKDFRYSQALPSDQIMSDTGDDSSGIVKDVMRWCEGMDQYGMLVWLAATLVKI